MSTTATTHPHQLRLPGQAAAPEGPCDLWMMYVAHHAYRRDLRRFVAAVGATPVDDRATWQALADRWWLFSAALHHHHGAEDAALWPLLTSRADAAGRAVLDAMEAEHAEIDPVLEAVTAGLATMAGGGPEASEDTRAALLVRLVDGRESLGRHLAHEETDAIALMQRLMTEPEWLAMQESAFKPAREEITLHVLRNMLGWTVEGLPADVRDRVLADPPVVGRVLWWLTRRGWARRERAAFRYAATAG